MIEVDVSQGIQVGGLHFSVDATEAARVDCRVDDRYGSCSYQEQIIRIDHTFPLSRISATFIHETLEAINEVYKLNLEHDNLIRLESGLHQVFESLGVRFVIPKEAKQ